MSSQFRTGLFGVGVIAVCLTMASLKGHHLLMAFAVASLAGSIWTWMQKHSQKPVQKQVNVVNRLARSNRRVTRQNVLQFPSPQQLRVSDASSS